MSELADVMFVEHVGSNRSPTPSTLQNVEQRRIAVLMSKEGTIDSLHKQLLRAAGKRRRGEARPLGVRWDRDSAIRWLLAEEIDDIYFGAAERLSEAQIFEIGLFAQSTRCWLIYTDTCRHKDNEHLTRLGVGEASFSGMLGRCKRTDAGQVDWRGFPRLPMDGPLRFRTRCAQLLDATELERVDEAMSAGVGDAFSALRIRESTTAEQVAAAGLAADVPVWPALAMLRGAQLAAFAKGWSLSFDAQRWRSIRVAVPPLAPRTIAAIRESLEPRLAVALILHSVSAAEPEQLTGLTMRDVSEDGAKVYIEGTMHKIPAQLHSTLRAHRTNRLPDESLFVSGSGKPLKTAAMTALLRKSQRVYGLPMSVGKPAAFQVSWNAAAFADQIGLQLKPLPANA